MSPPGVQGFSGRPTRAIFFLSAFAVQLIIYLAASANCGKTAEEQFPLLFSVGYGIFTEYAEVAELAYALA